MKDFVNLNPDIPEDDLKGMVASIERKSEHPIAKAISMISQPNYEVNNFINYGGEGVSGHINYNGQNVRVSIGNSRLLQRFEVILTEEQAETVKEFEYKGHTVVLAIVDNQLSLIMTLQDGDMVKPEAANVVRILQNAGIQVWMLTGDNTRCARLVANRVGINIENVIAECYPEDKKAKVEAL